MKTRIAGRLHLLLWTVYFCISLFNELYLFPSFSAHPSVALFLQSVTAQVLVFCLKIPAVYYVLLSVLPRWLQRPARRIRLAVEAVVVFMLLLLCYRLLVHFIIQPLVYAEPGRKLTTLQHAARFFYSGLEMLQVIGIATALHLFGLRIAAVKKEKVLVQEKLQSEMQALRAQINPHFLFNTLNSIYALSRNGAAETPDAVMRLSKILRFVLYRSEKKTIAIEEELRITEDYIGLQQMRFGNKVRVLVEKNVEDGDAPIIPLILLPLVENAFKHGTSDLSTANEIKLRVASAPELLKISVSNPAGALSVAASEQEGIGLRNIRRRLELMYEDYELTHGEKDGVFFVALSINPNSYAGAELLDSRR